MRGARRLADEFAQPAPRPSRMRIAISPVIPRPGVRVFVPRSWSASRSSGTVPGGPSARDHASAERSPAPVWGVSLVGGPTAHARAMYRDEIVVNDSATRRGGRRCDTASVRSSAPNAITEHRRRRRRRAHRSASMCSSIASYDALEWAPSLLDKRCAEPAGVLGRRL